MSQHQSLDEAQKKAIEQLEEIINNKSNEQYLDKMIVNVDIDTRLLKAVVEKAVDDVEEQIEQINESRAMSAKELAMIIKPRIEMIGYLRRKKAYYDRLYADPDYERCIFKLNNTIDYLIKDVTPYIQQFTGAFPQSMGWGYDTPTLWSPITQVSNPQQAMGVLMKGGKRSRRRVHRY